MQDSTDVNEEVTDRGSYQRTVLLDVGEFWKKRTIELEMDPSRMSTAVNQDETVMDRWSVVIRDPECCSLPIC